MAARTFHMHAPVNYAPSHATATSHIGPRESTTRNKRREPMREHATHPDPPNLSEKKREPSCLPVRRRATRSWLPAAPHGSRSPATHVATYSLYSRRATSTIVLLPPVRYIWRTGIFRFGHNIWRSGDTESKLISVQFKRMVRNEALHARWLATKRFTHAYSQQVAFFTNEP